MTEKENKMSKGDDRGTVEFETDNKVLKVQQFIFNNSKAISYSFLGIIVIVALIFVVKNTVQKNTDEGMQKAIVALDRILPYFDAPDYKKALFGDSSKTIRGDRVIGLLEIVEEFGSTKQGKVAALYAGNSYLAINKAEDAIEYFDIALDSPSKIVLEGAYAGLGACNEIVGEFDEAASYYIKSSEIAITESSKARYNYYAAKNYEKLGNKDAAEKIYKEIIAKNKYSEFSNFSKAGLVRLGMKID
ncbi:tol-pal system YbgF family protein [Bacteroidota bacterium]